MAKKASFGTNTWWEKPKKKRPGVHSKTNIVKTIKRNIAVKEDEIIRYTQFKIHEVYG